MMFFVFFFSFHNPCFQEPSVNLWLVIARTLSNSLTFPDLNFLMCKTKRLDEVSELWVIFSSKILNTVISGKQGLPLVIKGLKLP